jgi:hypothetical protein
VGDIIGEFDSATDADEVARAMPGGDLASSAPDADCPEAESRRRREAGLGRAKVVAPLNANELGGLPFPAARIR